MAERLLQERLFDPQIDTEEDVLAIRAKALEMLKEGKTVYEWESTDKRAKKMPVVPIATVLSETKVFLKRVNPDVYGRRVKRTFPQYLQP